MWSEVLIAVLFRTVQTEKLLSFHVISMWKNKIYWKYTVMKMSNFQLHAICINLTDIMVNERGQTRRI